MSVYPALNLTAVYETYLLYEGWTYFIEERVCKIQQVGATKWSKQSK